MGDHIKKNKMDRARGMCGRYDVCTVFWWGNLMERAYSDDLGVDDKIILKWMRRHGLD